MCSCRAHRITSKTDSGHSTHVWRWFCLDECTQFQMHFMRLHFFFYVSYFPTESMKNKFLKKSMWTVNWPMQQREMYHNASECNEKNDFFSGFLIFFNVWAFLTASIKPWKHRKCVYYCDVLVVWFILIHINAIHFVRMQTFSAFYEMQFRLRKNHRISWAWANECSRAH